MRMMTLILLNFFASLPLCGTDYSISFDGTDLKHGAEKSFDFVISESKPVLVWIRGGAGGGDAKIEPVKNCLRIMLDGKSVTPGTCRVLNKTAICFADSKQQKTYPLYDDQKDTWALKNSVNYGEFKTSSNTQLEVDIAGAHPTGEITTSEPAGGLVPDAWFSNHYEYVLRFDGLKAGAHKLSLKSDLPAEKAYVNIKRLDIIQPDTVCIASSWNWLMPYFPWQTPSPENFVSEEAPLHFEACAGEYEPVSFTLFPLASLPDVELKVSDLKSVDGSQTITKEKCSIFSIKSLERKNLGEAAFIGQIPFVPEKWKNNSPELLIPQSEFNVQLPEHQSQEFYIDWKFPEDQKPGLYKGNVSIFSSGKKVMDLPVECKILPFKLSKAESKYWMWRLQWSPIEKEENIRCLRDIREHGFDGLVRTCGAAFKFKISKAGEVTVDGSQYVKFVEALKKTGLELKVADDHVGTMLLEEISSYLGIKPNTKNEETIATVLPNLGTWMKNKRKEAEALIDHAADLDEDLANIKRNEVKNLPDAAELQVKIRKLAIEGFRKVKKLTEEMGLDYAVFPVDEPCGTKWRRDWTKYVANMAKEAGLKTRSTQNNFTWDSDIDEGIAGGMINKMYDTRRDIVKESYKGEPQFNPLPLIGGSFPQKNRGQFKGIIDDVRIYDRALSDEEILKQQDAPSSEGLIASYTFEDMQSGMIMDKSAEGNNAKIWGAPTLAEGKSGKGILLDGEKDWVEPLTNKKYDFKKGWSISFWSKGSGCAFGSGYKIYLERGTKLRLMTAEDDNWLSRIGSTQDPRFWRHVVISIDNVNKKIKAYADNAECEKWHRENVKWCYDQVRSMPPVFPRFKTGMQAWLYSHYGNLVNYTAFCYDWNTTHLYTVYPKNGDRFNPEGIWYRTLGWEGCREGIDDARYMQTLLDVLLKKGMSRENALKRIEEVTSPVNGLYSTLRMTWDDKRGNLSEIRKRIIEEIISNQK